MKGNAMSHVVPSDLRVDANQISAWSRDMFTSLREGGIDCAQVTCAVWEDAKTTLRNIGVCNELMREWSDLITPVTSTADIVAARESGRVGIMLGFQNTAPLQGDIYLVEQYARLGIKVMQLTYNNQNEVGSGCFETTDGGLTRFGRNVVRKLNENSVLVDLSHVGEVTSFETIEHSDAPVAITHANPRAWFDSPRNKSDELLKALADSGGVVGCTLYPLFIGGAETTLESFTGMVANLADMIGVEHIGIGTDLVQGRTNADLITWRSGHWEELCGAGTPELPEWPEWFSSGRDFGNLAEGFSARGFDESEVDLLMGGNWVRLMADVIG